MYEAICAVYDDTASISWRNATQFASKAIYIAVRWNNISRLSIGMITICNAANVNIMLITPKTAGYN